VQPAAPAGDDGARRHGGRRRRREVWQPVRQPLRRAVRVRQPAAAGVLPAPAAGVLAAASRVLPAASGVLPAAGDADDRLPAAAVRGRRIRADAGVHAHAVHAHTVHAQAWVQPDAVRWRARVDAVHADVQHAAGDALPAGPGVPAERRRRPPCDLGRGARRGVGGRSPGLVMTGIGNDCTDGRRREAW
jgi:hypothetical protein